MWVWNESFLMKYLKRKKRMWHEVKKNPFQTLDDALNKTDDGDTIMIASGLYNGTKNTGLKIDNDAGGGAFSSVNGGTLINCTFIGNTAIILVF